MPNRFTVTEKWEDLWFRKLSPNEKILFIYLCDKCDIAGFWEVDLELAAFVIGTETQVIEAAFEGLSKGYVRVTEELVWIKNFIIYQRNWPLKPGVGVHRAILEKLKSHKNFTDKALQYLKDKGNNTLMEGPSNPLGICKGKSNGNGKEKFLEFVFLTQKEYSKLVDRFGVPATRSKIQELNDAIGSKGYKYKSHYHTILNWDRRRAGEKTKTRTKLFPIAGKTCSEEDCNMPAVYKYTPTGGTYERYLCTEHLPESVKEKYE